MYISQSLYMCICVGGLKKTHGNVRKQVHVYAYVCMYVASIYIKIYVDRSWKKSVWQINRKSFDKYIQDVGLWSTKWNELPRVFSLRWSEVTRADKYFLSVFKWGLFSVSFDVGPTTNLTTSSELKNKKKNSLHVHSAVDCSWLVLVVVAVLLILNILGRKSKRKKLGPRKLVRKQRNLWV